MITDCTHSTLMVALDSYITPAQFLPLHVSCCNCRRGDVTALNNPFTTANDLEREFFLFFSQGRIQFVLHLVLVSPQSLGGFAGAGACTGLGPWLALIYIYIYIYSHFPRQGLDLYFTGGMCMTWSSGREKSHVDHLWQFEGEMK